MDWDRLLNDFRRKGKEEGRDRTKRDPMEARTETERDYDRILFSTPVRRLADKTQVFPLEKNDSVRTRLTHSHEVSNFCRGLGTQLAYRLPTFSGNDSAKRNLPAMLAAIGLAHDLGNPPFGHQGEHAIQSWFAARRNLLDAEGMTQAHKKDFLAFEGNAQTLRLVTRLQLLNDDFGLNLTFGTLGALMKYPTTSDQVNEAHVARKKHGVFQSELSIAKDIWLETGLGSGVRHPLTYLMEACDDIAYAILDAEDAVKKGLVSYPDLVSYLEHAGKDDPTTKAVVAKANEDHQGYRALKLSPAELNDISMQKFRVHSISAMISAAYESFTKHQERIEAGDFEKDLISISSAALFGANLKAFDKAHAYRHRSVLAIEAQGYNTIQGLMTLLWEAISCREDFDVGSSRKTPFAKYGYQRISENYRRIAESSKNSMPVRYRELQLLTDMVSGMTDSFAMSLHDELRQYAPTASKE